jgi:hypothetical protein
LDIQELDAAVAQTPAASEPVSQREDVHNDVAAAIRQLKDKGKDESVAAGQGAVDPDAHPDPISDGNAKAERPRGPDGKFLPKDLAADAPQAAPAQEIPSTDTTKAIEPQVSTPAINPPAGWTAAEKAEWSKLSPAVQAAVSRREQEISRGGQQWSEEKRRYEAVLAPVAQAFKARNLSVEDGLNRLLGAQDYLDRDPAGAIAWLAQSYGVDLQNLESTPSAPQAPRFDPMVQQLQQQTQYLESQLNGFLQSQTLGVIEQFAQGKPHYADVEGDLVNIIPMVKAANPGATPQEVLEKAYDQAIWSNPNVRAKLIAEQAAQEQAKQAEALKAKAAQAQKAAVSIKGSSNGTSAPRRQQAEIPNESVYDTVRRSIEQLRQH